MSYTAVADFKYGMDRRRPQSSGVPGTLWILKNAVISRGGDIERAKKFDHLSDLPSNNTYGLYSVAGQLYTFGATAAPVGMPTTVQYQQLSIGGAGMLRVLDAKAFDGKIYAIAAYQDGSIAHFYDGTKVTDWDTLADAAFNNITVAQRLADLINAESAYIARAYLNYVEVTAAVPGTAFTSVASATDNGGGSTPTNTKSVIHANVAAVAETRATAQVTISGGSAGSGNEISSVTIDGVLITDTAVSWVDSNNATATALANSINNTSGAYTASAIGGTVTIRAAPGTGATPNGDVVAVTTSGTVTVIASPTVSGGVTEVDAVAQVHLFAIGYASRDAADLWTITLDGTDYKATGRASGMGVSAYVHKNRVYSVAGSIVYYCVINDPTDWTTTTTPASDAGKVNIANEADGSEQLLGIVNYSDLAAVFARSNITMMDLPANANLYDIAQTLNNVGTLSMRSVVEYGANDVYYLDDTGIRSLRTRDTFDSAYASDVGSAIDAFIQELVASLSGDQASRSCAVIEVTDGRYMLALGQYVIILSYFPSSKITAWSYIDFGEDISDLVRCNRRIYLRADDAVYVYGGLTGNVYPDEDEFPILAETPFISAKDPATLKMLEGFDMAAQNVWHIDIMVDPNDTTKVVDAGTISGTTYQGVAHKIPGRTSHFGLRMTCTEAGYASLSSTAVHHENDERT